MRGLLTFRRLLPVENVLADCGGARRRRAPDVRGHCRRMGLRDEPGDGDLHEVRIAEKTRSIEVRATLRFDDEVSCLRIVVSELSEIVPFEDVEHLDEGD